MIHWGTTIPCTLYVDGQKKCDFHLPDNVSWQDFQSQVNDRFAITVQQWFYTCTNRTFSEQLSSEEEFINIKTMCSANQMLLQLNAVTNGQTVSQYNPSFQLAVELAVQSYLERNGPELIRDMLHNNRTCCCAASSNTANTTSSSNTTAAVQHNTDTLSHKGRNEVRDTATDIISVPSVVEMTQGRNEVRDTVTDITSVPSVVEMTDMGSSQQSVVSERSRRPSEDEISSDNKRPKVLLDKKIYMLACMDPVKKVIPGQKVLATWNLIVKHGMASQWEVNEDGGTLPHIGPVKWERSAANIYTFSSEFVAPSREGTFESKWSLYQDNFKRETFTFCKVNVSQEPLRGTKTLASGGNIPTETSVAKHLNSNKVFCLSKEHDCQPSTGSSEFVVIPSTSSAHALTNSTSSESSIEIIERSNDSGFFLHDSDFPVMKNEIKVLNAVPVSPSPFEVPKQNMSRSAENIRPDRSPAEQQSYSMIVDNIHQLNIDEQQATSSNTHPEPGISEHSDNSSHTSNSDMAQKLALLSDMGFTNEEENKKLLVNKSVEDVALFLSASDKI